jgi:SAM-dependent methyltransferase
MATYAALPGPASFETHRCAMLLRMREAALNQSSRGIGAQKQSVIPWSQIDTAPVPGGGELRLMRRGAEFSIRLGHNELMNSRVGGSEAALANLACERIRACQRPRMLIGGLGMGFTLRAALAALGGEARVVVAELVPAVAAWARGPMAEVFGDSLSDPRVHLREADVGELIRHERSAFDAILLDVDNGPQGLTRAANDGLYDLAGLSAAHAALRPGGVLAVWSSGPDADFSRRLGRAGFEVDEVAVRANGARGARHIIWIATRAGRGRQPGGKTIP